MNAHTEWKNKCRQWIQGRASDEAMLDATATYLHETADWIAVRDFLVTMAWNRKQCLDWFAKQDFPDFSLACEAGWGWPMELEDA